MKIRNASTLIIGFVFFTVLSGFDGCRVTTSNGVAHHGPHGGTVVVTDTPITGPVIYTGDLALTVYAPFSSALTSDTETFSVTVRDGGAVGPIVLQGFDYVFDEFGVGVIDISALAYGFYDIEIVGFDYFGNSVSYAASGVSINEPLSIITLELEAVSFSGDVVLDLIEPFDSYIDPIDTIDYVLYEVDPITNELTFVEEMNYLPFNPWDAPVIGALGMGEYYIELYANDSFGYTMYEFNGNFFHDSATTYLPMNLWFY